MSGKKKIDLKSLLKRTLSGAVILAVTLVFGILGGWPWFAVCCIISLIALFEFYRAFKIEKTPLGIIGFVFGIGYWVMLAFGLQTQVFGIVIAAFLILSAAYVFDFERVTSAQAMASIYGLIYTVVLLSFMYLVRMMKDGLYLVWLIYIGSWVCDTCAYFSGVLLGKHKMSPVLSPKKSIEGAVGGVLGTLLVSVIYGLIAGKHFTALPCPALACAAISCASALISMVGDLTASAFKRTQGIKDYSNLIPGHGGILDRFDSVIFVGPVIYFGAWIFMKLSGAQ